MPPSRRPPTKVVDPQCPRGAPTRNRSPRGALLRVGAILVMAPASSIDTPPFRAGGRAGRQTRLNRGEDVRPVLLGGVYGLQLWSWRLNHSDPGRHTPLLAKPHLHLIQRDVAGASHQLAQERGVGVELGAPGLYCRRAARSPSSRARGTRRSPSTRRRRTAPPLAAPTSRRPSPTAPAPVASGCRPAP